MCIVLFEARGCDSYVADCMAATGWVEQYRKRKRELSKNDYSERERETRILGDTLFLPKLAS